MMNVEINGQGTREQIIESLQKLVSLMQQYTQDEIIQGQGFETEALIMEVADN